MISLITHSKSRIALALFSLLLLLGTSATGQKRKKTGPCVNPQTQYEMNQCAKKAFEAADATLNPVYQRLLAMLDADEKAQLQEAQRAWLKYRDTNCEFVADEYKGGSIRPMILGYCLADMTKRRTSELRTQINERSH